MAQMALWKLKQKKQVVMMKLSADGKSFDSSRKKLLWGVRCSYIIAAQFQPYECSKYSYGT